MKTSFSVNQIIFGSALFLTAVANVSFFSNVFLTYGAQPRGFLHALSLGLVLLGALVIVLALLCFHATVKLVLTTLFIISAITAYFMDSYNVVIDTEMIANAVATDRAEAMDLITTRLTLYVVILGIMPSVLVARLNIRREPLIEALRSRALLLATALPVIAILVFSSSAFYASFFREQKVLRYYTNPLTPLQGVFRYVYARLHADDLVLQPVGLDARAASPDLQRELVILVIGETARADRFSLNGYERETNPRLKQDKVISFSSVSACGTSTVIAVPCIFSALTREAFDVREAENRDNLLDVVQRAGVRVLWRDNNSNSKGVADRVQFEDFRSAAVNPLCDSECRDEGMLAGLQQFIDLQPTGDILIVLHQMGSHGPSYYKRYPDAFRRFLPTCDTNQLNNCTQPQISNSYDNTILYTDHFLSEVIRFLRGNSAVFAGAMLYVSDHGESLGEGGLYLHGLPYLLAPAAQTRVPVIFWSEHDFAGVSPAQLNSIRDAELSHDNIFHSVLGMFGITTRVYDAGLDIFNLARQRSAAASADSR